MKPDWKGAPLLPTVPSFAFNGVEQPQEHVALQRKLIGESSNPRASAF
jgi:hypothetical protein